MEDIRIIKEKISLEQLKEIAKQWYGEMVKGVVNRVRLSSPYEGEAIRG